MNRHRSVGHSRHFRATGRTWNFILTALGKGNTPCLQRTSGTTWTLWCADRGPEIHQGLIHRPRAELRRRRIHEFLRGRPELSLPRLGTRITIESREPRMQTQRVGFDNRRGLIERKRGNRTGSVSSNSRQLLPLCGGGRQATDTIRHNLPGGAMQITGAAVVSESFPQAQHRHFVCGSQRFHGRKGREKPFEIRHNRGNGRLLQHDFTQPHTIGIAVATPGKFASVTGIPTLQGAVSSTRCAHHTS